MMLRLLNQRADAERILLLRLREGLCLSSRAIFVVGMLLHVDGSQSLSLVDERTLLGLGQVLPLGTESL